MESPPLQRSRLESREAGQQPDDLIDLNIRRLNEAMPDRRRHSVPPKRRHLRSLGRQRRADVVSDDMFVALRAHWSEEQIVEIVAVIAMAGFLARWNGTMATPRARTRAVGQYLAPQGWSAGVHDT